MARRQDFLQHHSGRLTLIKAKDMIISSWFEYSQKFIACLPVSVLLCLLLCCCSRSNVIEIAPGPEPFKLQGRQMYINSSLLGLEGRNITIDTNKGMDISISRNIERSRNESAF